MTKIIENTHLDEADEEFKRMLLNREIHLVCEAANSLTALNAHACMTCRIDFQKLDEAVELVNTKLETGTLHPLASISILPLASALNNTFDQAGLNISALQNCLRDVLVANEQYIQARVIYFSLETYTEHHLEIKDTLRNLLDGDFKNATHVKEIHFSI